MAMRTTVTTVTFHHSFKLSAFETAQPPGTYKLVCDDEEIEGISFPAFRRISTWLQTPAIDIQDPPLAQTFMVDHRELEAALDADSAKT